VGGYEGSSSLESSDNLYFLEEKLEEEVKKEILMALEKTQKEYSSDIFGFGTYVRKYHPRYWKNAKEGWDKIFSKLQADIRVDAKIVRTGIVRNPLKEGK